MRAAFPILTLFLVGCETNAVPFYGDLTHHFPPPRIIQPKELAPFGSQTQKSRGYPQIWHFANNPFPVNSNFDFTLDHQRPSKQGLYYSEIPFDIDVVTSEDGGEPMESKFYQQPFPFLDNDFVNSFVGFGLQQEPWWKGPNVCTKKEEAKMDNELKDIDGDVLSSVSETSEVRPPQLEQFHFSVNSCVEKPNKHVCTRSINQNGKRKTLTVTRQCCQGYGRTRNADVVTACEKIEIKNIEKTAEDMGAKEFIVIAKSNGFYDLMASRKNVTIFMPIDSAIRGFNEQMLNEKNLVESKPDETMQNLFIRHIVPGEVSLDDVLNEEILKTELEGQSVRINSYKLPSVLTADSFRFTANCIPIEKHDKLTEQGLLHTLGGVLKPVTLNVMDIIRQRADMSIMRTVLEKTKLNELLESENTVTIFVPTNAAFEKLEPHLKRAVKEGKGCASNILRNHILDLTFCSAASIADVKTTAYNILGEAMRFNRSKPTINNSDVFETVNEPQIIINGIAKIVEADLMGTNGVVHVIDTVIYTASAQPLSSLMNEKNVTLFKRLLEAAGIEDNINDMANVTIFAPTDKALQGSKWVQLLEESPEKLKNNGELLEVINYHVVSPMIKTCDLSEKMLNTTAGTDLRINLYSTHALFSNIMNRATVNCARLVHFDDESCGSVLHQIDKLLTFPKSNLLQLIESNPNYSKFVELVRSANLTQLLADSDQSFTLLVPKNDAFEEVRDWEKTLTKEQTELEYLVKHHIVNDVICCAGIIPTNWPFVRTIETLNGAHLHITRERRPMIENAGVIKCDALAANGIIHEINDIIVPMRHKTRPQQPQHQLVNQFGDLFF